MWSQTGNTFSYSTNIFRNDSIHKLCYPLSPSILVVRILILFDFLPTCKVLTTYSWYHLHSRVDHLSNSQGFLRGKLQSTCSTVRKFISLPLLLNVCTSLFPFVHLVVVLIVYYDTSLRSFVPSSTFNIGTTFNRHFNFNGFLHVTTRHKLLHVRTPEVVTIR